MRLTNAQVRDLVRESIEKYSNDYKLQLVADGKISITRFLIGEGFRVAGILNFADDDDLLPSDEGEAAAPVRQVVKSTYTGDAARKIHAAVDPTRKVHPAENSVNGFADQRSQSYDLYFDDDYDGLMTRSDPRPMSGVDTGFPVYAAYTTTKPLDDSPPCVEMLLNAIKQKDSETPYRIDFEQLQSYEMSAAERLASSIVSNIDPRLKDLNPIFIVVACPSRAMHTQNLAALLQNNLQAGRRARNNPNIFIRQPSTAGSFVNLLKKVTYGEAADAINNPESPNHVTFSPDNNVMIRHQRLHEMWTNYVQPDSEIESVFRSLKQKPDVNWLRETVANASSEDHLGGPFDQILLMIETLMGDYVPGFDDNLLSEVINGIMIDKTPAEILGVNDSRIPGLEKLLVACGDRSAMTKVHKAALEKYQASLRRLSAAELNTRQQARNPVRISESTLEKTYSMSFDEWVAQQQHKLDQQIARIAQEDPDRPFSISKISAQSGNRKHVKGFIVDNPDQKESEDVRALQASNPNNRPYVLVIVDDNVESGTTMREVARQASSQLQELTGGAGFSSIIGATALAIRGPTVRCSSIIEVPYNLEDIEDIT